MLYQEFIDGTKQEKTDGALFAYNFLNELYMEDRFKTKKDLYKFFVKNKEQFLWVDTPCISPDGKRLNCPEIIEKDQLSNIADETAIQILKDRYNTNMDLFQICGWAYYKDGQSNLIRYIMEGQPYVLYNGIICKIYV